MPYEIVLLNNGHVKKSFSCGYPLLDNYIQRQAKQDVKRDLAACYVLVDEVTNIVAGYYTLSSNSVDKNTLPAEQAQKSPPAYQAIPTILLGRLAIDSTFKGQGLGEILLFNALERCFTTSKVVGSLAIIVDPIDGLAVRFYLKYGFILLPDSGKMILPMKTIESLMS